MKSFKIFLIALTAVSTFALIQAHAVESTGCQNVVQAPDAKSVNCSQLQGDARTQCEARAARPAPATSTTVPLH